MATTVSGGVADLSSVDGETSSLVHLAGHTAVVYDPANHSQLMLQGHCNPISCMCVSADKTVVATADAGAEAMVVLWDAASGAPLRTIAAPHDGGVAAMDLSRDGSLLATMAAPLEPPSGQQQQQHEQAADFEQEVALWQLDGSHEVPAMTAMLEAGDLQTCVRFRAEGDAAGEGDFELVSNGDSRVCFWTVGGGSRLAHTSPTVSARDFKQSIGQFTVSAFMPQDPSGRAVTGTADGDVVVWERAVGLDAGGAPRRRAVKVVQLHQAAITCLVNYGAYLVSGGAEGYVRWFDGKFRLEAWFEELAAGGVHSISFAAGTGADDLGIGEAKDDDEPLPDFIVGTAEGKVLLVRGDSFEDGSREEERLGELVAAGVSGNIYALAASPTADELAVAGVATGLEVWDYAQRRSLAQRGFPDGGAAVALAYSSDGLTLAAGFYSGHVGLYDAHTLEELAAVRFSSSPVVELAYRADGQALAVADAAMAVGLVRRGTEPPPGADDGAEPAWEVAGRHKAHHGAVTGLAFASCGEAEPALQRLFSVGEDGVLVEYDVQGASAEAGLPVVRHEHVASEAAPTGLMVVEPRGATFWGKEDALQGDAAGQGLLLVADSEYKLRSYTVSSLQCVGTALAPTYAGPVNRMLPLGDGHVVYGTVERVVGLLQLPLTGDPNSAMGLIAHPGEMAALALSRDGTRLFTAGAADGVVSQWRVDAGAFEAAVATSQGDDARCAALIEGGKEGAFYGEIVDYFGYAQIRAQGESTRAERRVEERVTAKELPDLMRALGYYPSERDIADMMAELDSRGLGAGTDGKVPFRDFLNLYTNYRPVFGVQKEHIEQAFAALAPGGGMLSTKDLLQVLTTMGDKMSVEEVERCLLNLLGEEGAEQLPAQVDAHTFAELWLGFEGAS